MAQTDQATASRSRVLVLCTGNSCRSQMAEGLINQDLGTDWEARSAGTRPAAQVHPLAVRALAELGIDISGARPRHLSSCLEESWDLTVTVCDSALESCPVFPRPCETLHLAFFDPAVAHGSEEARMVVFRRVRDQIRTRLLPEIARRKPGAGRPDLG